MLDMIFSLLKNRKQISFIIIDTYSTLNFYYCLIISVLARFFQIPYYTHLHGGDLNDRLRKSPFFCDLIFKNSKNNISPSKFLSDSFLEKVTRQFMYQISSILIYINSKRGDPVV